MVLMKGREVLLPVLFGGELVWVINYICKYR
jgi:hypothetical protein